MQLPLEVATTSHVPLATLDGITNVVFHSPAALMVIAEEFQARPASVIPPTGIVSAAQKPLLDNVTVVPGGPLAGDMIKTGGAGVGIGAKLAVTVVS